VDVSAQAARHAAFVHTSFGDQRETGQQPLMIKQQMQLHRSFRAPVLRPVENRSAEFDQRGVQRQHLVFETEPMRAGHFAAAGEQVIKDSAIESPGTVFVGIGQRGTLGRVRQQLAFAGGQPAAISRSDCARPNGTT